MVTITQKNHLHPFPSVIIITCPDPNLKFRREDLARAARGWRISEADSDTKIRSVISGHTEQKGSINCKK